MRFSGAKESVTLRQRGKGARLLSLILLCSLAACGPPGVQKVISAADISSPEKTRLLTLLRAQGREGATEEESPSGVGPGAIRDEAVLRRLTPTEACFEVIVRTAIAMDEPLASWRIAVDDQVVRFEEELVTVRDHPCTGEPPTTVLERIPQKAFEAKRIGEPRDIVFRVVERRALGCFKRLLAARGRVRLALALPAKDGKGQWTEVFEWRIVGE